MPDTLKEELVESAPVSSARKNISLRAVETHLSFATCSERLRNAIFRYHPLAAEDSRAFRYVVYALFGKRDQDTGLPLLGQDVLAWIDGKPLRGTRWGKQVLMDLKKAFPRLEWRNYVAGKKPRLLENDGLSKALKRIAEEERRQPKSALPNRVHVLSGERYERRALPALRQEMLCVLKQEEARAPSENALYIFRRMNSRPSNVFTRYVVPRVPEAREALKSLEIDSEDSDLRAQLRAMYLQTLSHIEDQPQPFYTFSQKGRTDRIVPFNASLLTLPSELRDILTRDFVKVDLKSAHLIIAAALWDCQEVAATLTQEDYSVWADLYAYFSLDDSRTSEERRKRFKAASKEAIYSTIFGMSERNLKGQFTRSLGDALDHLDVRVDWRGRKRRVRDIASDFFVSHPLIRALLDAREEALGQIERDGGATTAAGTFVPLDPENRIDAPSVMATVAQSYEQAVMKAILEYEQDHFSECKGEGRPADFRVTAWIHDGCTIHFTRRQPTHLKAITGRVRQRALDLLGVPMMLEVE